ncbi:MAG TPA: MFS transporter [Acidimicrobiales bacterium]|jgi:MFS family permease|nr:MFS transporter [Acidimicrobiales bacterium]
MTTITETPAAALLPRSISATAKAESLAARKPRYGSGFWLAAGAFLVAMAFSTVPTPLYVLYQRRDGFSSFVVTIVFAVYAVGVITSLLLGGHVSDWLGRRRVLVPALATEAAAAVLFLVWPTLPGLIVARLVSGLGVGLITATATAHLRDLQGAARPGAGSGRFEVVSTAANLGGLGVGTLISGALAQFFGSPLVVPYAVFAVLLLLAVVGLAFVPETVRPPDVRPRYRPQRVSFDHGDRRTTAMAAAAAFVGFAVFGLFTSLAPGFVGATLHHPGRLLAGLLPFMAFGAAALAQTATGRLANRARMLVGTVFQAVGMIVLAVAMEDGNLAAFLIGGALAGAGAGILFKAALASFVGGAEPQRRGEAASSLFLAAYAGLILPVIGIGVLTLYLSAQTAMLIFTAALLVILAAIGALALRPRRPGAAPTPPRVGSVSHSAEVCNRYSRAVETAMRQH